MDKQEPGRTVGRASGGDAVARSAFRLPASVDETQITRDLWDSSRPSPPALRLPWPTGLPAFLPGVSLSGGAGRALRYVAPDVAAEDLRRKGAKISCQDTESTLFDLGIHTRALQFRHGTDQSIHCTENDGTHGNSCNTRFSLRPAPTRRLCALA